MAAAALLLRAAVNRRGENESMDAGPQSTTQPDWIRWLPGLQTLRAYDPAWLVHDLGAGLVLTTVLAPVGIAYAVASGLPGVCGLYATIIPLLAYAVSARAASWSWPRFVACGRDSRRDGTACRRRRRSRRRACRNDGDRIRDGLHRRRRRAAGLHHRASVEAHPLRLHEWDRAGGRREPGAEAPGREDQSCARSATSGRSSSTPGRSNELGRVGARGRDAGDDPLDPVVQGNVGHSFRRCRRHRDRSGVRFAGPRQCLDFGPLARGLPAFSIPAVGVQDLTAVAAGGIAVALVSFADTSVLSRAYAARFGASVDPNREMVGLGAANLPPDSSKDSRSAAVRRARRSRKPPLP